MTIGRWNGVGDGTLVNPFIITMPIDYDPEEPFQIRLDSNYLFNSGTNTYFKFSTDPATIYLLAIVVKDSDTNVYFKSTDAISYTMLLTSIVDYTDGPFITNTFAGVHYLLKQQIFSQNDVVQPSEIPSFIITALEPAARKQGDFWFDLELQAGQTDDTFDTPATNFIVEEADLLDVENTPFVLIEDEVIVDEGQEEFPGEDSPEVIINEAYEEFVEDNTETYDALGNYIVN